LDFSPTVGLLSPVLIQELCGENHALHFGSSFDRILTLNRVDFVDQTMKDAAQDLKLTRQH